MFDPMSLITNRTFIFMFISLILTIPTYYFLFYNSPIVNEGTGKLKFSSINKLLDFLPDNLINKNHKNDQYIVPSININYSEKYKSKGVFATKNYKKDDIIELCPCIQVNSNTGGLVRDYLFYLNDKFSLLGLGYCSLYNHSDDNNAKFNIIDNKKIRITCVKDINEGEEITVNYGDGYWKNRKNKI